MFLRLKRLKYLLLLPFLAGLFFFCAHPYYLFAQESPSIHELPQLFSNQFGQSAGNSFQWGIMVGVIGVFLVVIVLVYHYHGRRQVKGGYHSEKELFNELSRGHHLSREQKTILKRIAKELEIPDPCLLFVEPQHLEQAIYNHVVPYPTHFIQELLTILFGGDTVTDTGTLWEEGTAPGYTWTSITDGLQQTVWYSGESPDIPKTATTLLKAIPQEDKGESSNNTDWDYEFWDELEKEKEQDNEKNKQEGGKTGFQEQPGVRSASHFAPVLSVPPLRDEVLKTDRMTYHAAENTATHQMITPAVSDSATTYKPEYPEKSDAGVTTFSESPAPESQSAYPKEERNSSQPFNSLAEEAGTSITKSSPHKQSLSPPDLRTHLGSTFLAEDKRPDFRQTKQVENPTIGTQVFSSLIQSFSQVSKELTVSSIQNLLNRPISLSPGSFHELKESQSVLRRPATAPTLGHGQIDRPKKPVATGLLEPGKPKMIVEQIDLESLGIQVAGQKKSPGPSLSSNNVPNSGNIDFWEQLIASKDL